MAARASSTQKAQWASSAMISPRIARGLLQLAQIGAVDTRRVLSGAAFSSLWFARRQAQAGQEQLAVLGVAKRRIARHDNRGNGAQPGDGRTRLTEPAHVRIACRKDPICPRRAWIVLNSEEQIRRRFVEPAFEEMGPAQHG